MNPMIVLENINLTVPEGSFLAIVGPNGSGKSTLLNLILGLLKRKKEKFPYLVKILIDLRVGRKLVMYPKRQIPLIQVFQQLVFEVVASGLTKKLGLFHFMKKEDKEKVNQALEAVGMANFKNRNIGELSGGQQQRVFIARALVSGPKLLILG